MFKLKINNYLDNAINEYMAYGAGSQLELYIDRAWAMVSEYDKNLVDIVDNFDRVLTSTNYKKIQVLEAIKSELDNKIPNNLEDIK